MNERNLEGNYRRILLALILLLSAFAEIGFGCSCQVIPPCVNYSKSDKVFVGKLKKIDPSEKSSMYALDASFEVQKVYKGNVAKTELITIEIGSCERKSFFGEEYFSVGKTYFVYADNNLSSSIQYCDRTGLISEAKLDLEYVNSLSDKQPNFLIYGDIYGLSEKELSNIKIQIKSDNKSYNLTPDKFGSYEFKTIEDKSFNVEILFPPKREIRLYDVIVNYKADKTTVEYPAKFIRNGCSYRTFEVEE